MDIQEMVNARIEDLRRQSAQAASTLEELSSESIPAGESHIGMPELGDLMDEVLTEIAGRVLELTEQVSRDYARLEKDLLNSRLALLQGAESVLDMALALRSRAASIIEPGMAPARGHDVRDRFDDALGYGNRDTDGSSRLNGRASMLHNGVADLFRKTQN